MIKKEETLSCKISDYDMARLRLILNKYPQMKKSNIISEYIKFFIHYNEYKLNQQLNNNIIKDIEMYYNNKINECNDKYNKELAQIELEKNLHIEMYKQDVNTVKGAQEKYISYESMTDDNKNKFYECYLRIKKHDFAKDIINGNYGHFENIMDFNNFKEEINKIKKNDISI